MTTPEQWGDEAAEYVAANAGYAVSYVVAQWLANIQAGVPDTPADQLTTDLARVIFEANDLAWRVGDQAIADLAATVAPKKRVRPFGLHAPAEDLARLVEAVNLIFDGRSDKLLDRMERIAAAEPLRAAKRSKQAALKARGVKEWVRVVQPTACEPCTDMLGQVSTIDTAFMDHPGCRCSLRAVLPKSWGDIVGARQLQLRSVSPSGVRFSSGITFEPIGKAIK